ncbi:MAG: hypothetical protein HWN66_22305, partial [Candidatus Helarchaeota archaeon]|nr:hypothetical protein [Candidatus Helarchaeota archaeon]
MIKLKNTLVMLLMAVFFATSSAAEAKNNHPVGAKGKNLKKIEFGFFFGPAMPRFDLKNSIADGYHGYWYNDSYVTSTYIAYYITAFSLSSTCGYPERSIGIGGFINYFFRKNFGFQFMLEKLSYDFLVKTSHNITMIIDGDSHSANPLIKDTMGSLPVMPISFNVIAQSDSGKKISVYTSGGLTYYKADIAAQSKVGDGFPYIYYWDEYDLDVLLYDSVVVPVDINDSISGAGVNGGGGIVFTIGKNLGFVADFRYYLAPKKDAYWMLRPKPGEYPYSYNSEYYLEYDQSHVDAFLEKYAKDLRVGVSPSFYRLAFGLKFS